MTVEQRSYSLPRREALAMALRRVLSEAPALPAQAAALLALLYLAATDGGYYPLDWYPIGLLILALLAVWSVGVPHGRGESRVALVPLLLLALFAVWALVSISWADEPSAAWDGANRAVLYAALFALFGLWPVGSRQARWLVALLGLGIALIGLVELVRWAGAADPDSFMLAGRLSEPVGYQNGDVALWLMGAFACLWLAAEREAAPVTRGLALGAVPMLASLAWLGQSRGSLFAVPVALLVFLAIAPGRLRLLAALAASALATAVAIGPALEVIDAPSASALPPLVDDAARAILIPAVVLAALGALAALAERRWTPSPGLARRITAAAGAVVVLVALAGAAIALTQASEIRSELSDRWDEFKSNEASVTNGSARLRSGGTNRYDFWTVAWDSFEREPLRGVGMDNFQQDYIAHGESDEKPRFPHSFELALLSQTGIVGAVLMLAGIATSLAAALLARRRLRGAGAGVVAGTVGVFGYWLLHTSVDWLYELPALGGIAFAMLGLATAVGERGPRGSAPAVASRTASKARVVVPVLAGLAVFSFAPPWLAEREVSRAVDTWRAGPDGAYERLDRAAALNPLSVRPALFEAAIAVEVGQATRAERAYREVIDREPRNAYAWLQLAALASTRQDPGKARRLIARAAALAPHDRATRLARAVIVRGGKITPRQVNRAVLKYARGGTG